MVNAQNEHPVLFRFSIEEWEILFVWLLPEDKLFVANCLVQWFKKGGHTQETIAPNWYKTQDYQNYLYKNKKPEETKIEIPLETTKSVTKRIYNLSSWYTAIRTAASPLWVGIHTAIDHFVKPIPDAIMMYSHAIFGVLSFSYALDLVLDIGVMVKGTFFPKQDELEDKRWKRAWNIFNKDKRPSRIINAAVSLGINIPVFLLTGAFSVPIASITAASLIVGSYVFDVLNPWVTKTVEIKTLEKLKNKITDKEDTCLLAQLDNKIKHVREDRWDIVKGELIGLMGAGFLFAATCAIVFGAALVVAHVCLGVAACSILVARKRSIARRLKVENVSASSDSTVATLLNDAGKPAIERQERAGLPRQSAPLPRNDEVVARVSFFKQTRVLPENVQDALSQCQNR